jgi:hypothetical protein
MVTTTKGNDHYKFISGCKLSSIPRRKEVAKEAIVKSAVSGYVCSDAINQTE